MNSLFDKLSSSTQLEILNLNQSDQNSVMMEIMKQNASQNMNSLQNETIILPTSMADELYKKLPILAVESDTLTNTLTDTSSDTLTDTSSNTTGGSIKKISIS